MFRPILPLAALLVMSPAAQAEPFATFNQAALAQGFDLPVVGHGRLLQAGESSSAFSLDLTSEYSTDTNATETVTLDGESARLTGRYRAGLGNGLEWGAELAAVHVGGGFMDSFIESWHDFFGLPNGGRELAPQDRYQYRYEKNGVVLLDRTEEGWALGDLRVSGGWAATDNIALRAELKLPTGDEDKLTGGNLGGAVWADWALLDVDSRWSAFVSAGLSANQKGDVLEDQQETLVPFGSIGGFLRATQKIELGVQLYGHGALYKDSELDQLSRNGLQIAFGGRWIEKTWALDIAFQEDLITKSSPDFSVHIGVRLAPQ